MCNFTYSSELNTHSPPTKFCKRLKHMSEFEREDTDMWGRSCLAASPGQKEMESYKESQRVLLRWMTFPLQNPLKLTVVCWTTMVVLSHMSYSHWLQPYNAQSLGYWSWGNARESWPIFYIFIFFNFNEYPNGSCKFQNDLKNIWANFNQWNDHFYTFWKNSISDSNSGITVRWDNLVYCSKTCLTVIFHFKLESKLNYTA